jgi:hypothetical protein
MSEERRFGLAGGAFPAIVASPIPGNFEKMF